MKTTTNTGTFLRYGSWAVLLAAMVMTSLLMFGGCSQNSLGPAPQQQDNETLSYWDQPYTENDGEPGALAAKVKPTSEPETESEDEGDVTVEDGGTIPISLGGFGNEFHVPPGAVDEYTAITVEAEVKTYLGAKLMIIEFGPDGLVFKKSAKLKVKSKVLGWNTSSVNLYWLNTDTNRWEYQGTYQANRNGKVDIPIDHFSKYGIS